jgi:hypothetical protein
VVLARPKKESRTLLAESTTWDRGVTTAKLSRDMSYRLFTYFSFNHVLSQCKPRAQVSPPVRSVVMSHYSCIIFTVLSTILSTFQAYGLRIVIIDKYSQTTESENQV